MIPAFGVTPLPRFRVSVRSGGFDSLTGFTLLSLLAHLLVAGAAVAAASIIPAPRAYPPDPGFFVRLADLPPGGGMQAGQAPGEEAPGAARTQASTPERVVIPDVPEKRRATEAPKPRPADGRDKTAADRPAAEAGSPRAGGGGAAGGGEAAGGGAGPPGPGVPGGEGTISSVEISDFPHAWYTARLVSTLRGVWRRPFLQGDTALSVMVTFVIRRDGEVEDVTVTTPSGYEPLDLSAVRAVYDAKPLPPLPAQWPGATLSVGILFELTPGQE